MSKTIDKVQIAYEQGQRDKQHGKHCRPPKEREAKRAYKNGYAGKSKQGNDV